MSSVEFFTEVREHPQPNGGNGGLHGHGAQSRSTESTSTADTIAFGVPVLRSTVRGLGWDSLELRYGGRGRLRPAGEGADSVELG